MAQSRHCCQTNGYELMSLERGFDWDYSDLNFKGYSIAGQTTSMVFQNAKICFDIGPGLPFHMAAHLYCLTHLHADHGAGINFLLSQRSLFSLPQAKIMLPSEHIDLVDSILKKWMEIEGFNYNYQLIPSVHGQFFDFNPNYSIKSFRTTHRIPSYGYIIYEKKKKLKKEFQNLKRNELIELRDQGVEINESILNPLVCFTGDTQIEFLKSDPDVLKAKVLFVECTYLDNKRNIEQAREWGHIHLDEIIKNINELTNEHISLIHLSARYSTSEASKILDQKIPETLRERFSIFPRPF